MRIHRAEQILGESNFNKLCERIRVKPSTNNLDVELNPIDQIIQNYLSMLDAGYNESDAITQALITAHTVTGGMSQRLANILKTSPNPAPIIIDREAARRAGFPIKEED